MMPRRAALVLALFAAPACREAPKRTPKPLVASAAPTSNLIVAPTPTTSPTPAPTRAATPPPPPLVIPDGGAGCRLVATKDVVDVGDLALPSSCAHTEKHVFCMEPRGAVARCDRAGPNGALKCPAADAPQPIAHARAGTRIAAADVGAHEVLAFLADARTSEGLTLHAFVSVDGAPAVRVSEDGAGATSVDVAPRGSGAGLVAYLDARGAMTPVHARALRDAGAHVELGKDAVVFIGGAPDPNVAGAIATSRSSAFYVLPIARDASTFGMAIVTLDDPPKDDEPVSWAMYAYGIDPAPFAVTRGAFPIHVARVVPTAAGAAAPRAVELGVIADAPDGTATYAPLGASIPHEECTRVAVALEPGGTLLVRHSSPDGARVDRVKCALPLGGAK